MSGETSFRVLAALLAGAIAMSAGAAWAQSEGTAASEADCEGFKAEWRRFSNEAYNAGIEAKEADETAKGRRANADAVRALTSAKRADAIARVEAALNYRLEQRAKEAVDPELDALIEQLRLSLNALKDAQHRATDVQLTGGFISSDRNALDASARELEARAAAARTREQELTWKAEDAERSYEDCRDRQRAALLDEREQRAPAVGGGGYDAGIYGGGYDGVAVGAYPPPPSQRPPRVRPARTDRWDAGDSYADPVDMGGGRRARRAGGRDNMGVDGRPAREGRKGGKAQGGGKKHRGGHAGPCHTNPQTGQLDCGDR